MDLKALIESGGTGVIDIDGITVSRFSSGVLNIGNRRGELTREQVDTVRALLASAGYREHESWIATQGMSWLSSGTQSVSMRVEKVS